MSLALDVLMPLKLKKEKNHIQPNAPNVSNMPFQHSFIVYCYFLIFFVVSHFSLTLMLFKCVFIIDQA
jgi:hypothetical protein